MRYQPSVPRRFNELLTHVAEAALAATAALVIGSTPATAQPVRTEAAVMAEFHAALTDYVELHRRVEQSLEPMVVTADLQAIERGIAAMAAGIRAARPDARQGGLYTPELAAIFRARINEALVAHGMTVEAVRAATIEDGGGSRVTLAVNGAFPWHAASAMPACLFEALPELPPELEYRLVGPDMVLVDLHANLIVDVLRHALATTAGR